VALLTHNDLSPDLAEGLQTPSGVGFAVGAEFNDANAFAAAFQLACEGGPGLSVVVADAVGSAELAEVGCLWGTPELFKVLCFLRDGKVIKDPAALVVHDDDGEVTHVAIGGEQGVAVV
jgi:hypothetical protein